MDPRDSPGPKPWPPWGPPEASSGCQLQAPTRRSPQTEQRKAASQPPEGYMGSRDNKGLWAMSCLGRGVRWPQLHVGQFPLQSVNAERRLSLAQSVSTPAEDLLGLAEVPPPPQPLAQAAQPTAGYRLAASKCDSKGGKAMGMAFQKALNASSLETWS